MATVETGIALRDRHMRDNYVEVAEHPNVVLTLARSQVTWPVELRDKTTGTLPASFTAHGVEVEVEVD